MVACSINARGKKIDYEEYRYDVIDQAHYAMDLHLIILLFHLGHSLKLDIFLLYSSYWLYWAVFPFKPLNPKICWEIS